MNKPSKSKALERLRKALEPIPNFQRVNPGSAELKEWQRNTRIAIKKVFIDDEHVKEFDRIQFDAWSKERAINREDIYQSGLISALSMLRSMIHEVEDDWPDEEDETGASSLCNTAPKIIDQVFIIHGRDNEVKETVARFIEKLGLKPVILHEQPSQGRTLMEKFEQHAEVGYAIALLTSDDVGALRGDEQNSKPRARQNVIFELGYFMGRFGRARVCALTKGDLELPSDYANTVYVPFNSSGGWKFDLVKDLRAAGFEIDANLVF